jgi:hypothetical protein
MLLTLLLALAPQFASEPTDIGSFEVPLFHVTPIEQLTEFKFESLSTACIALRIIGPCPGLVTVTVAGGIPGNLCHVGRAWGLGAFVVPSGPCTGTVLGLNGTVTPVVGSPFVFNPSGEVAFTATVPAIACGNVFVQAMESPTCCTSNVIAL